MGVSLILVCFQSEGYVVTHEHLGYNIWSLKVLSYKKSQNN